MTRRGEIRREEFDGIMREIREMQRSDRLTGRLPQRARAAYQFVPFTCVAKSGSTGIAGLTTAGAGLGTVTIQTLTTGGVYADFLRPGTTIPVTLKVQNTAGQVGGTKILQVKQESVTGRMLVDVEDCTT